LANGLELIGGEMGAKIRRGEINLKKKLNVAAKYEGNGKEERPLLAG
jgi:hypothetical protein